MLNKITLILFKYIPAISIVFFLINNGLYFFINEDSTVLWRIPYLLDGISGSSFMLILLLLLISYKFKYCAWHRILLVTCLFNISIAFLDSIQLLQTSSIPSLLIVFIFSAIGCSVATILHLHNIKVGNKTCIVRHSTSKRFDLALIAIIRWYPIIQLIGFLFSNTIALLDIDIRISYLSDFIIGNSLLSSIFIYLLSLRLNFSYWHRTFIVANLINGFIAFCDAHIHTLPISDMQLYGLYYIVLILCLISVWSHQNKSKLYEYKTQIA